MNDRAFIRSFEGVRDRRFLALTILGLLAFAAVLIAVVAGFRGNHVSTSADAMVFAGSSEPRTPTPPAAAPLK